MLKWTVAGVIALPLVILMGVFGLVSIASSPSTACVDTPGMIAQGQLDTSGDKITQIFTSTVQTTTKVKGKTVTTSKTVTNSVPVDPSSISVDSTYDGQDPNNGTAEIDGGQFAINGQPLTSGDQVNVQIVQDQGAPSDTPTDCTQSTQLLSGGYLPCTPGAKDISSVLINGQPPSDEQLAIALKILNYVKGNDQLGRRDALLGLNTSLQETQLHNYPYGTGDSVGIFQQTHYWGSPQQRLDLDYAINAFFSGVPGGPNGVLQVPNRDAMSLKDLAIAVQHPLAGAYDNPSNNFDHWTVVAQQLLDALDANCSIGDTGVPGKVIIAAGADLPGRPMTPETLNFLATVAGIYGRPLICTTGTNHSYLTVDGLVSDHVDGHACDFGMNANGGSDDSPIGDAIATACLVAAGVPPPTAAAEAQQGGLYTIPPGVANNGLRVQCIWKTYEGGNHHNHVHIGARPG